MASSQTTSLTEKKKGTIIDGRLFVKSVVMNRIQKEHDDSAAMALVVSRIKQTGLFNLGRQHSELYDESLVEEFYQEAFVRFRSEKKGGGVAEIFTSIRGVEIRINRQLLEDLFSLPSYGLKLEELESFGSEDLLTDKDLRDKIGGLSGFKIRVVYQKISSEEDLGQKRKSLRSSGLKMKIETPYGRNIFVLRPKNNTMNKAETRSHVTAVTHGLYGLKTSMLRP
ncbi:hypothetical protein OROMI_011408 [Orobanche minor]